MLKWQERFMLAAKSVAIIKLTVTKNDALCAFIWLNMQVQETYVDIYIVFWWPWIHIMILSIKHTCENRILYNWILVLTVFRQFLTITDSFWRQKGVFDTLWHLFDTVTSKTSFWQSKTQPWHNILVSSIYVTKKKYIVTPQHRCTHIHYDQII